MVVWSRREVVKPEPDALPRLLRALVAVAVCGTALLFLAFGPFAHMFREGARWIDTAPATPVLATTLIVTLLLLLMGHLIFRSKKANRPEVVRIQRCQSGIWEGQAVIRVTEPGTAKIRFVLHTNKKAS